MIATRLASVSLAMLATIVPAAVAQNTMSGVGRYLGTTQQSINRANASIASMAPSISVGGGGTIGTASGSINRTNAAMRAMRTNRAATIRGLGQQAVYRTSDNLYGVYWQNYYMRRAHMFSNYLASAGPASGNGLVPTVDHMRRASVSRMMMADNVRRRLQQKARGEEIIRRQNRLNPTPDPGGPGFGPDVIRADITPENFEDHLDEAGMLRPTIDITAPVPITPSMTRGRPDD